MSISGAPEEQFVTLSFRQNLNCDADGNTPAIPVEVKSENYANVIDPFYTAPLTVGNYDVNASTSDFLDVQYNNLTIMENKAKRLDISFP